ncbi:MAG: hypothetical protein WA869_19740 [Alloacidobacterium sp.]|jgi:hypothetical protein
MNPTRRSFLHGAALAVLTSTLSPLALAQRRLESKSEVMDENLSIFDHVSTETFEEWIGSSFKLSLNGKLVDTLVLVSVKKSNSPEALSSSKGSRMVGKIPGASIGPSISSFSLRFRGTGNALPQDTYTLNHSWLGAFPLFLVPSGIGGARSTYTATFNVLNSSNE